MTEEIIRLFEERGEEAYFGEAVSQKAHGLQAAYLATLEEAPDSLVVAALLHDIGHMLHGLPEDIATQGRDGQHEAVGEAWLTQHFGQEITEPVRLHVDAKRYLCAVSPDYFATLSPASVQSLALQGGAFTSSEVQAFESNPYFREAVRLRHWDDQAKVVGWEVPDVVAYRARLEAAVTR